MDDVIEEGAEGPSLCLSEHKETVPGITVAHELNEFQLLGFLSYGFFHKVKGYCTRYQLNVDYFTSGLPIESVQQLYEAAPEGSAQEMLNFFCLVEIVYSAYFKKDASIRKLKKQFSSLLAEVISSSAINLGIRCSCYIDPALNDPMEYRRVAFAGAGLLLSVHAASGNGTPHPGMPQSETSRDVYHGLHPDCDESYFFRTSAEPEGWTAVFSKGNKGTGRDLIQDTCDLQSGLGSSFFPILSSWNGQIRNSDTGKISFFVPYTDISN